LTNEYVYQGGSIRLRVEWRTHPRPGDVNPDTKLGLPIDPTGQTWYIKDPSGTLITTVLIANIHKESLGIYFHDYATTDIATVGTWTCKATAVIEGVPDVKVIEFDVKES
jgi:hypothetical protein